MAPTFLLARPGPSRAHHGLGRPARPSVELRDATGASGRRGSVIERSDERRPGPSATAAMFLFDFRESYLQPTYHRSRARRLTGWEWAFPANDGAGPARVG